MRAVVTLAILGTLQVKLDLAVHKFHMRFGARGKRNDEIHAALKGRAVFRGIIEQLLTAPFCRPCQNQQRFHVVEVIVEGVTQVEISGSAVRFKVDINLPVEAVHRFGNQGRVVDGPTGQANGFQPVTVPVLRQPTPVIPKHRLLGATTHSAADSVVRAGRIGGISSTL